TTRQLGAEVVLFRLDAAAESLETASGPRAQTVWTEERAHDGARTSIHGEAQGAHGWNIDSLPSRTLVVCGPELFGNGQGEPASARQHHVRKTRLLRSHRLPTHTAIAATQEAAVAADPCDRLARRRDPREWLDRCARAHERT